MEKSMEDSMETVLKGFHSGNVEPQNQVTACSPSSVLLVHRTSFSQCLAFGV